MPPKSHYSLSCHLTSTYKEKGKKKLFSVTFVCFKLIIMSRHFLAITILTFFLLPGPMFTCGLHESSLHWQQ